MSDPINPTGAMDVNGLPDDAVALLVWREGFGPQPLTIIVTQHSWDKSNELRERYGLNPETTYDFESPINDHGRKTIFSLKRVIGWCGNVHSGIVPAKGTLVN